MNFNDWIDIKLYKHAELYKQFGVDRKDYNRELRDYRTTSWFISNGCLFSTKSTPAYYHGNIHNNAIFRNKGVTLILLQESLDARPVFYLLADDKELDKTKIL